MRRDEIFAGRLLRLVIESKERPDGTHYSRELVLHPGAVAILPILSDGRVLLVEQYRPAVDSFLWEIPAGLLETGETPLACAKRELLEETGHEAGQWEEHLAFYTSPGFTNEQITLFAARALRKIADPHPDEISRCRAFDRTALDRLMNSGEIKDAKTILAISLLSRMKPDP